MAYAKLILDSYDEEVLKIQRLKRFNNPFVFANGISLAAFEEANEAVKQTIHAKNDQLAIVDKLTEEYQKAVDKRDKMLIALRGCIGSTSNKESDEFVTAGGTRQSEVIEKQQHTRGAKKKADEVKDKPTS